ncbi:hypothetical protein [Bdellovibrio bacteriovorus]|uniref:hypothetical protein n=1 Tax=Bdellovibrio bacteriovorus TaxID=959 RepID=UPI0035A8DF25
MGRDLFAKEGDFAVNASNLIVDRTGGVLAAGKSVDDRALDWEGSYERLVPGESTDHKKSLSLKYKSLMGVLDYYFMKEKKRAERHAACGFSSLKTKSKWRTF